MLFMAEGQYSLVEDDCLIGPLATHEVEAHHGKVARNLCVLTVGPPLCPSDEHKFLENLCWLSSGSGVGGMWALSQHTVCMHKLRYCR